MFLSAITTNLNWEVSIQNLILKDGMELRMKNFDIIGLTGKSDFQGGFTKNQYIEENFLKSGAWTVCKFNVGLAKKEGGVFEGD